ncbi:MAG: hypothetical protein U0R71_03765 [Solirubrobacterales bacterium]
MAHPSPPGAGARRLATLLAIALLLALPALASVPARAHAAASRFIYELCDPALPAGNSPQLNFVVNPGLPITYWNNCSQAGGSLGVQEYGHAAAGYAYLSVGVPSTPGGFVEAETITASANGLGPGNDHTFVYEQPWPPDGGGEVHRTFFIRGEPNIYSSGGGFELLLNCNGNYAPGCEAGPTIAAHYIAALEVDPHPPTIPSLGGSLLEGGVLRGHQELLAEAKDTGGGVSRLEVLINGTPAPSPVLAACNVADVANTSYTGLAAISPSPCPPALKTSWDLNTGAPPFVEGANTVQVCTSDFATVGEADRTCSTPQALEVDNSCTESPVPGGEVLSAQFAGTHSEEVTVPYNRAAKVSGELADNAGDAIAGATICVQAATQGSHQGLRPIGTAITDAQGHFVYAVPPGPNRQVLVGYRHDSFQVGRSIRYYAHAKPTIKVRPSRLRNGNRISITGKLPGGRARGRVIVLQASALRSHQWFTFRRVTTGPHGHYRAHYRFDATTETVTYRIRAVVPRQRGYPWEVGHSKPARVKVWGH